MVIGISVFELHIPHARSLKQKRKVVRGLMDRIHHRFRVSISETDFHDLHQRSEIAVAAIARSETDGQRLLESIRQLVDLEEGAVLVHWDPQLLEDQR